uniref:C2H2-type domain-containing protein n=1 Tax=viral metagenome TaxID=1070528 RepID=A0A6C0HWE4_9ZZZZ
MDSTTHTCNICIKTFSYKSPTKFYAHMHKHLTPEYKHLFSKTQIKLINKARINLNNQYLRTREKKACKVCNKKICNKQALFCHMKIHLVPKTIHLFSEEEIKLIEEIYVHRKQIKKHSRDKIKNDVDEVDDVPPAISIIPIPPLPFLPVPDLIPI